MKQSKIVSNASETFKGKKLEALLINPTTLLVFMEGKHLYTMKELEGDTWGSFEYEGQCFDINAYFDDMTYPDTLEEGVKLCSVTIYGLEDVAGMSPSCDEKEHIQVNTSDMIPADLRFVIPPCWMRDHIFGEKEHIVKWYVENHEGGPSNTGIALKEFYQAGKDRPDMEMYSCSNEEGSAEIHILTTARSKDIEYFAKKESSIIEDFLFRDAKVCEDCGAYCAPSEGRPVKYERSRWKCDDCHNQG